MTSVSTCCQFTAELKQAVELSPFKRTCSRLIWQPPGTPNDTSSSTSSLDGCGYSPRSTRADDGVTVPPLTTQPCRSVQVNSITFFEWRTQEDSATTVERFVRSSCVASPQALCHASCVSCLVAMSTGHRAKAAPSLRVLLSAPQKQKRPSHCVT